MQHDRLKVVFIGHESRILSYLASNQDQLNITIKAVYVTRSRFSFRYLRRWLAQFESYQRFIYWIKSFYPGLKKKHWRHFALYEITNTAKSYHLPCVKYPSVNHDEFIQMLKKNQIDVGIVSSFAQKLDTRTLKTPRLGFINFHPGELPRYRGKDPIKAALKNRDEKITVCWHRMIEQIDAGEVLAKDIVNIENKNAGEILNDAVDKACRLLKQLLPDIAKESK